jgi:hypothetical protein
MDKDLEYIIDNIDFSLSMEKYAADTGKQRRNAAMPKRQSGFGQTYCRDDK